MAGQTRKWVVLLGLCALCLWLGDARPCFSRAMEPAPVAVLAAGPEKHVIKAGETINLLALRYGVPAAAILKANPGLSPTRLQLGKTILIPSASGASGATGGASAAAAEEPAQAGKPVELRPEKAPQATQPLVPAPQGRDLVDIPAKPVEPLPVPVDQDAAASRPVPAKTAPAASEAAKRPRVEDIWPMPVPGQAAPSEAMPRLRPLVASLWLLGLLGVVVLLGALALRGVLANLGAGLALLVFRFPRTGTTVRIGDRTGRVISRGLFFFVVRTRDSERIIVPNARVLRQGLTVLPARDED